MYHLAHYLCFWNICFFLPGTSPLESLAKDTFVLICPWRLVPPGPGLLTTVFLCSACGGPLLLLSALQSIGLLYVAEFTEALGMFFSKGVVPAAYHSHQHCWCAKMLIPELITAPRNQTPWDHSSASLFSTSVFSEFQSHCQELFWVNQKRQRTHCVNRHKM